MHVHAAAFFGVNQRCLLPFRYPLQSNQPQIVPPVHETFVGFAQMRGITAFTDLVGHDAASLPCRLQVPSVIAVLGT